MILTIPKQYNQYLIVDYVRMIKEAITEIKIDNRIIDSIIYEMKTLIKDSNEVNDIILKFMYLVYKISSSDTIDAPLSRNGRPKHGFSLVDKRTDESLGIYHSHLSDNGKDIIVWYVIFYKKALHLKIKYYRDHPENDYNDVIEDIYTNDVNGFNIKTYEKFQDSAYFGRYIVTESIIIKDFNSFVKMINENISDKNHNIECVSVETLTKLRTQSKSEYNYDLEKSIEDNGIIKPLLIIYHVHDNKAALSDGHNRLDVAINLGLKCLPSKVIVSGTDAPMNAKEVKIPNWKGKDEIKPSEIGLF